MLICGLMFSTFSVELVLVQNRLQLSFILLLSTFTFKHSVNATLPKVPYLTYLVSTRIQATIIPINIHRVFNAAPYHSAYLNWNNNDVLYARSSCRNNVIFLSFFCVMVTSRGNVVIILYLCNKRLRRHT